MGSVAGQSAKGPGHIASAELGVQSRALSEAVISQRDKRKMNQSGVQDSPWEHLRAEPQPDALPMASRWSEKNMRSKGQKQAERRKE